jgi:hypothetical protein
MAAKRKIFAARDAPAMLLSAPSACGGNILSVIMHPLKHHVKIPDAYSHMHPKGTALKV